MFERAARMKLRFATVQGNLMVEDLWDLPLNSKREDRANLDSIACDLHASLQTERKSFTNVESNKPDEVSQLRFDIVKHIIDVRLAEKAVADDARTRAENKQKILSLIARKEDDELAGTSLEELRKLAANM